MPKLQVARWAHNMSEKIVRQNGQTRFPSGRALTGYCNLRHRAVRRQCRESGICVPNVRVLHECVHANDGCKSP